MSEPTSSVGPGRPKDPAKREAILEAAKRLFLCNGYDGSSMEAIASEAGVSKLTVYSHFTDKETLFSEAVKAKCAEQLPALYFQLAEGAPLEKVLLNIARGFHRLINSHEAIALTRLMAAQAGQNPKLSELFFEAGPKQVIDEMERLLEQARRSGKLAFPDARHAAEHFFMLVKGCANYRLLIGCAEPLDEAEGERHVDEVVALFLRAFAAGG
ncbi:efflux system transcriptional repressor MexL [Pseudomonas aeruginosa]|nr:efflux system transcriptional repressor MexL [Pseudomonas aeruginosa]